MSFFFNSVVVFELKRLLNFISSIEVMSEIVSNYLLEPICSHKDLVKEVAQFFFQMAVNFMIIKENKMLDMVMCWTSLPLHLIRFEIVVVSQFKLQRVKRSRIWIMERGTEELGVLSSSFPPRVLKLPFVGVSSVFRLVTEYSISLSLSSIPLQFQGNIINKSIMFHNLSLLGSMDPERCPDICIMLVDPDPRSSQNTLALLVNLNYRVVTAFQGADALETLKKKKRRVDLVLMPTELPDMCTLEVLDILKSKYNMAVVMLVDTDQPSAKEEFLWNGAMFCYKKPLDSMSAATLWQHAFVKEAELFSLSLRPPRSGVTINDFGKIHVAKRKFEGSSSFTWTPYIENIFLGIVHNLGVYDADPLEVLNRMHVPGLTLDEVTDKLQEYQARQNNPDYPPIPMRIIDLNAGNQLMGQNIYANPGQAFAHEQGILQNPRQDQLNRARAYEIPAPPLALVTSVPFVPHVPNMPQLPQASVPPANTAQMLIVPPWPPAPTYLPSSSVAPPAPGHGEDEGKLGG